MAQLSIEDALTLGMRHHAQGELDTAETIYQHVLAVSPDQPHALHLLGVIAIDRHQFDRAIELLNRAISINPEHPDFHFNLGIAWAAKSQWDHAVNSYKRPIAIEPENADAHNNLGGALLQSRQIQPAVESYERAIALRPDSPVYYNNLSSALCQNDRFKDAANAARHAVELQPDLIESYMNLGTAELSGGNLREAIRCFEAAIRIRPDGALAHHYLGLSLLAGGDMARGWEEYEWRLRLPGRFHPQFSQPIWNGSALQGKRIVLWHEQGFGDTFQFARYAPLVAARGGRVVMLVPRQLRSVLATVEGVEQVISGGEPLPPFDVHCPLASLPYMFRTTLETIPAQIPYVSADDRLLSTWRRRMGRIAESRNVGVVWAGHSAHHNDRHRSIPLSEFAPLAAIQNVRWFSLQLGPPASQPRPPGLPLIDLTSEIRDFADTAAILSNLDLLISVDTSVVHLAGALGKHVWVLLPAVLPDWRWLTRRGDSDWYPTARLFRQSEPRDWGSVIARVRDSLRQSLMATEFPGNSPPVQ